MDEPTARLIAEKGIWLSTQAFPDEMADAFPAGSKERAKAFEVFAGTDRTFELARKYKIKPHSERTFCSQRSWRSAKASCWPSSSAGTRQPKRSPWRLGRT